VHEDDGPRERPRRDGDLVRDPRRSIAIGAGMLAGVAALAIMVASDVDAPPLLQWLDDAWRRTALGWPGWTGSVGEAFEGFGAGVVMVPLRIVVAIWLVVRRRRWDLAAWLLGWILADVLTAVLKPGLARARPTAMDPENPFTSFPSAHAKTAAQVAIGLVLVASSPWRSRRGWYALAAAWIVLMATSRTVVDHHWLSDVLAGSLLGAGAALLAAGATQLVRDGRARAQMPDPGRRDT
jgi:membrane-associated phospholipid phosphatase